MDESALGEDMDQSGLGEDMDQSGLAEDMDQTGLSEESFRIRNASLLNKKEKMVALVRLL